MQQIFSAPRRISILGYSDKQTLHVVEGDELNITCLIPGFTDNSKYDISWQPNIENHIENRSLLVNYSTWFDTNAKYFKVSAT